MANHVLPGFRFERAGILGGLPLALGILLMTGGGATAASRYAARSCGQAPSRPAGRPVEVPIKDKAKDDKEKIEIPHVLDWLNDDWVVISVMVAVFVIIIIWVYVKVFRRLDTVAYLKRPSPRGVLYVPQEIVDLVDRQLRDKVASAEERQKLIDAYTLRYYFGGQEVICRHTPDGLAAMAVGPEEVKTLLDKMSSEEKANVRIEKPQPWEAGPITT